MSNKILETLFIENALIMSFDELSSFINEHLSLLDKAQQIEDETPLLRETYDNLLNLLQDKIKDNFTGLDSSLSYQRSEFLVKLKSQKEHLENQSEAINFNNKELIEIIDKRIKSIKNNLTNVLTNRKRDFERLDFPIHPTLSNTKNLLFNGKLYFVFFHFLKLEEDLNKYCFDLFPEFQNLKDLFKRLFGSNPVKSFDFVPTQLMDHKFKLRFSIFTTLIQTSIVKENGKIIRDVHFKETNCLKLRRETIQFARKINKDLLDGINLLSLNINKYNEKSLHTELQTERKVLIDNLWSKKRKTFDKLLFAPEVKKLNWKLLPPGKWTAEQVIKIFKDYSWGQSEFDESRLIRIITNLKPNICYIGNDEFKGYVVFCFNWTKKVVLECPKVGNAIYIIKDDWKEITKSSKFQALQMFPNKVTRIIHNETWLERLKIVLKDKL